MTHGGSFCLIGKSQTTTWNYDLYGPVSNKVDAAGNVMLVCKHPAERLYPHETTAQS